LLLAGHATLPLVSILDLIVEKQRRLVELESEIFAIKKELTEARQALLGSGISLPDTPDTRRSARGNSTTWAADVLRKAGQPMHVNEIMAAIEREYHVSVRYATIVGNIARLVKKGRMFSRVGPNRFGLLEWGPKSEEEELYAREMWDEDRGQDGP
jgi:hypothetical protein